MCFVGIPETIYGESNQKMLFLKELRPVRIEQNSVGLNRETDTDSGRTVFFYRFYEMLEEG